MCIYEYYSLEPAAIIHILRHGRPRPFTPAYRALSSDKELPRFMYARSPLLFSTRCRLLPGIPNPLRRKFLARRLLLNHLPCPGYVPPHQPLSLVG